MEDPKIKSHCIKLARYLKETIEQAGFTPSSFADRAGIPKSTVYQLTKAQAEISRSTSVTISDAFKTVLGVEVGPEELLAMLDDAPSSEPRGPKKKREIQEWTATLWHLQRTPIVDRVQFWKEALKIAADDVSAWDAGEIRVIPLGRKPAIDTLIQMINDLADRHGLRDTEEFARWIAAYFDEQTPEHNLILIGLAQIFIDKEIPNQHSVEYAALMSALARALGFPSSSQLQSYCGLKVMHTSEISESDD